MACRLCASIRSGMAACTGGRDCWRTRSCSAPTATSNGCVSFKDYNAFLRAYENGQIKKLAVVARL